MSGTRVRAEPTLDRAAPTIAVDSTARFGRRPLERAFDTDAPLSLLRECG